MPNLLYKEKSPYLLQHADNPIDCVVEGIGKRLDADLPFNTYYRRRKY